MTKATITVEFTEGWEERFAKAGYDLYRYLNKKSAQEGAKENNRD